MDHAGEGALAVLLLEDVAGLVVGLARVDDQRQAGLARAAIWARKLSACSSRGLCS